MPTAVVVSGMCCTCIVNIYIVTYIVTYIVNFSALLWTTDLERDYLVEGKGGEIRGETKPVCPTNNKQRTGPSGKMSAERETAAASKNIPVGPQEVGRTLQSLLN